MFIKRDSYKIILTLLCFIFLPLTGCFDNENTINYCLENGLLVSDINLTIDGSGLFVLRDGGETFYTRKGAFCVDSTGYMINETGINVTSYIPITGSSTNFNTGTLWRTSFALSDNSGAPLNGIGIDQAGVITGHYLLSASQVVGKMAIAAFPSHQNLLSLGNDLCQQTFNSGEAITGEAGAASFGNIISGALEGSYECDRGSGLFNTKLSVDGDGYFRLDNQGTILYARELKIGTDANGYLVNIDNYQLSGYAFDQSGNIIPTPIGIPISFSQSPSDTSQVIASINLDATSSVPASSPLSPDDSASYNASSSVVIYDSLGSEHTVTIYFVKLVTANTWDTYAYLDDDILTSSSLSPVTLTFNGNGSINAPTNISYDSAYVTTGAADLQLDFDYTNVTQHSGSFIVTSISQNGYPTGRLTGINFTTTGLITVDITNGQTLPLGQIALANFAFPNKLRSLGDGTYLETSGSGLPTLGLPGSTDYGQVVVSDYQ